MDWKSNYIETGYSYEMISNNILKMHYDLQIKIYTRALIRWLRQSKTDYAYDRHFGGVYYLYMRGIDPNNKGEGIFFFRPEEDPEQYTSLVKIR